MKTKIWFGIILMSVLAISCVRGEDQVTSDNPPSPIATQDKQFPDHSNSAVIIYSRSGGIAGTSDSWTVFDDNRFIANSSESSLDESKLASFLAEIESLGFFDLEYEFDPFNSCADCFIHELTISYNGRINQVSWQDGDPDLPMILHDVWSLITRFLILEPPIVE